MYERSGSQAGAGRMSVHPLQGGEASSEGDRKKAWSETAVHHGASEKLEARGLIVRSSDEQDQRVSWITLSDEGRRYIRRIKDAMKEMEGTMFRDILPEERLLFRRLLLQIRENLMTKEAMESCKIHMKQECMSDLDEEI